MKARTTQSSGTLSSDQLFSAHAALKGISWCYNPTRNSQDSSLLPLDCERVRTFFFVFFFFLFSFLSLRGGSFSLLARRSQLCTKLAEGEAGTAGEKTKKLPMELCASCRRPFGQRCERDGRVTQRCGGCGNCSRLACCACELGSDFGSSDSEPDHSPVRTPRSHNSHRKQYLSRGDHNWGTTAMTLDEVLVDMFANRQRIWTMNAVFYTPEKKERPKKAGARRQRRRHRRRRPAGQE